jgi:hypothetical protein
VSSLRGSRLLGLRGTVCPVPTASLSTCAADGGHVQAIPAHYLTTFSARSASLVGGELVSAALCVGGLSALARDLTLPCKVH